jgi:hypothetical protein
MQTSMTVPAGPVRICTRSQTWRTTHSPWPAVPGLALADQLVTGGPHGEGAGAFGVRQRVGRKLADGDDEVTGAAGQQPGLPGGCGGEGADTGQVGAVVQHPCIIWWRAQHAVIVIGVSHGS